MTIENNTISSSNKTENFQFCCFTRVFYVTLRKKQQRLVLCFKLSSEPTWNVFFFQKNVTI